MTDKITPIRGRDCLPPCDIEHNADWMYSEPDRLDAPVGTFFGVVAALAVMAMVGLVIAALRVL